MRGKARSDLDEAIAELAERQHGKVSRRQLLALGLGEKAIEYRLRKGFLRPDRRGVYALGHRPSSRESRWMSAVLYVGQGAVLSHWSAASLARMRPGTGPLSHVTCPRRRASVPGIRMHHGFLLEDEMTVQEGIPVTTPARTLIDLAPLLPSPTLGRLLDAAPSRGAPLAELLDRYPRKPGAPRLRKLLGTATPFTRSDFEANVLARIEAMGLPPPEVNAVVEGFECDLVWRAEQVIAELDSYVTHGSRLAFEHDRERDRKLVLAEWQVTRITDERTEQGLRDLGRLLAARATRPGSRIRSRLTSHIEVKGEPEHKKGRPR